MVQIDQKWYNILELFYRYPNKRFTIREISKKTKIPKTSVQRYVIELKKSKFLTKDNMLDITPHIKFKKTQFIIDNMFETGLIDYLEEKLIPSCIILFGGVRKGEYDHESDIDLFIETTKKTKIDLSKYEKKLGHKIHLFIKKEINDLPKRLLNNVVNGIKIRGYFKIR